VYYACVTKYITQLTVLKRRYFMAVIHGVFCLHACMLCTNMRLEGNEIMSTFN